MNSIIGPLPQTVFSSFSCDAFADFDRACEHACVRARVGSASSFGAHRCIVSASVHVDAAQTNKKSCRRTTGGIRKGGGRWLIVKTSWCGSRLSASYYFSDSACECCYWSARYTLTWSLRETYSRDLIGTQYRFQMND